MLDYENSKTAFLDINQAPVARVRTIADIDRLVAFIMEDKFSVRDLICGRAKQIGLRYRPIEAPANLEIA